MTANLSFVGSTRVITPPTLSIPITETIRSAKAPCPLLLKSSKIRSYLDSLVNEISCVPSFFVLIVIHSNAPLAITACIARTGTGTLTYSEYCCKPVPKASAIPFESNSSVKNLVNASLPFAASTNLAWKESIFVLSTVLILLSTLKIKSSNLICPFLIWSAFKYFLAHSNSGFKSYCLTPSTVATSTKISASILSVISSSYIAPKYPRTTSSYLTNALLWDDSLKISSSFTPSIEPVANVSIWASASGVWSVSAPLTTASAIASALWISGSHSGFFKISAKTVLLIVNCALAVLTTPCASFITTFFAIYKSTFFIIALILSHKCYIFNIKFLKIR